jgi:hypothetical protein
MSDENAIENKIPKKIPTTKPVQRAQMGKYMLLILNDLVGIRWHAVKIIFFPNKEKII